MRLLIALLALLASQAHAQAPCRQALALGLDVSGSVDAREYALQRDGLAGALLDPDVARALLSAPSNPVWLSVYEWSGQAQQRILLDWTAIDSRGALEDAAATIAAARRALGSPETALGTALLVGSALLARRPNCASMTLDISGDGKSNQGPRPRDVKDDADLLGVTVNGLVVGEDRDEIVAELSAYFRAEVIRGPNAFVEVALGYEDYEKAMVRKLLRELEGLNVAAIAQ